MGFDNCQWNIVVGSVKLLSSRESVFPSEKRVFLGGKEREWGVLKILTESVLILLNC